MPSYKLTYFNLRGRGEVTRYMFKLKDVEFEDHRITHPFFGGRPGDTTWFQEVQPTTPFGKLPVFEADGAVLCQSHAIERLIAKRLGLYGANDMEQARSDMIVACAEDIFQEFPKARVGCSEEDLPASLKKLSTETLPALYKKLEAFINDDGYFINKQLMWADIAVAHLLSFPEASFMALANHGYDLSPFPKLKALKEKFESIDKIAAWIKARPESIL